MKIDFVAPKLPKSGAIAAGVMEDGKLSPTAAKLDQATAGALTRAMKQSRFKGKKGQLLEVLAPAGLTNSRILLVGLGKPGDLGDIDLENAGGTVVAHLSGTGEVEVALAVDRIAGFKQAPAARAARHAMGALLRAYRFDKYRTKEKPEDKPSLKKVTVMVEDPAAARRAFAGLEKVAEGVFFTRDLVSEPANILYPKTLAAEGKKLEALGVKVEILGQREMRRLGMGALLGVAQGSAREPQLLVLRWTGAGAKPAPADGPGKGRGPVAFVGKGVTFDTGGISLKPPAHMEDMKWDMGGAGVVIGLMRALAGRKAKLDALGVCGLVENMPSATAQRPGDIVTTMSGQTVEVINTDAEGRLVLADALWYAQEKFKPRAVIDLATLTGAVIVALGHEHAGLFSNDDKLAEQLLAAGTAVGEPLWRMPLGALGEAYDKAIDSEAADMKNVGSNRAAGSVTGAQFLQRFIKEGTPWAHLDIAGVTWASKDKPIVPKGGTGFGVRLLDRWVAETFEG